MNTIDSEIDIIEIQETMIKYLSEFNNNIKSIYLFGSRARNEANPDSDFDFFIILNDNKSFQEKRRISKEIRNYLISKNIIISMDLVIKNLDNWAWESENYGYLAYTVKNEGILL
ncbi:MAG: nucleotidyltransferase domain-containing protein [Candidatus Kapabacteria bacterium]|nr:nucleotidyltransferase domain-containing protein [Candidatus Kapabacteria bacterium]